MSMISVIVPCYNEEEALPIFYEEMIRVCADLHAYEWEYILVDDGSKDHTLSVIKALEQNERRVHHISFSRNFGKEAAIYAGLFHAHGEYVVLMDADLQDPPKLLPDMIHCLAEEGYDSVATRRVSRKGEPKIRSFFARVFYQLINRISKADIVDGARDYRMMNRTFVDAVLAMSEYNRFSKGIFGWVGFSTKWLEYENIERSAGETKWSFWKLFKYSIDGIVGFSTAPLSLASITGMLFSALAICMIILIVIRTMLWGDPVAGWPSMICVIFLLGGIQLLSIGILGQYLAKTYLETKKRPLYLIKDQNIEH